MKRIRLIAAATVFGLGLIAVPAFAGTSTSDNASETVTNNGFTLTDNTTQVGGHPTITFGGVTLSGTTVHDTTSNSLDLAYANADTSGYQWTVSASGTSFCDTTDNLCTGNYTISNTGFKIIPGAPAEAGGGTDYTTGGGGDLNAPQTLTTVSAGPTSATQSSTFDLTVPGTTYSAPGGTNYSATISVAAS